MLGYIPSSFLLVISSTQLLGVDSDDLVHIGRDNGTGQFNLQLDIRLSLLVKPVLLTSHLKVVHSQLMRNDTLLEVRVASTGCLDLELNLAAALDETQKERGFVDSVADGDEAVVEEQGSFTLGAQRAGNLLTLLLGSDDTGVLGVNGKDAVDITDVLCNHLERLAKDAPGAACNGVGVANGVDVMASLVDLGVNIVAGVVGRTSLDSY